MKIAGDIDISSEARMSTVAMLLSADVVGYASIIANCSSGNGGFCILGARYTPFRVSGRRSM
jgi:hypothetical protein